MKSSDQTFDCQADLSEFTKEKHLGHGVNGAVNRYIYNGSNPLITSLLRDGLVVIKEAENISLEAVREDIDYMELIDRISQKIQSMTPEQLLNAESDPFVLAEQAFVLRQREANNYAVQMDENEQAVLRHLNQMRLNNHINDDARFPKALVVKLGEKKSVVSELINYAPGKSANLESFIQTIVNNNNFEADSASMSAVNISALLVGFANSMKMAQGQLHQCNVLHLDTACRNFVVAAGPLDNCLKIIDFGLSRRVTSSGKIIATDPVGAFRRFPATQMDKRSIDSDTNEDRVNREYSFTTDLFAQKVAIIEMVGLMMGKNPNWIKDYYLPFPGWMQMTDTKKLTLYLENLQKDLTTVRATAFSFEGGLTADDVRRPALMMFIERFKPYLANMPSDDLDFDAARRADFALFNACKLSMTQVLPSLKDTLLENTIPNLVGETPKKSESLRPPAPPAASGQSSGYSTLDNVAALPSDNKPLSSFVNLRMFSKTPAKKRTQDTAQLDQNMAQQNKENVQNQPEVIRSPTKKRPQ